MTSYPTLFSPVRIGPFDLPNRIVMGSMHMRFELADDPQAAAIAFYEARARGGAALLVTGGVSPLVEGAMETGAPLMESMADADFWRPVVDAVHDAGGRILLQLLHAGRYARVPSPVGASAVPSPINRREIERLDEGGIARTLDAFGTAAALARTAGFDGVELMGSEGYLLNQFVAARTNNRDDYWGGDAERRRHFPVEAARRVREGIGDSGLLVYRLSAIDLVEDGADADQIDALATALAAEGVDAFNSGIGWHEARVPTIAAHVPPGAWRFAAARLKRATSLPVIGTNRLNTPELAEAALASGEMDMVAMARPLLADPDLPNKARNGQRHLINICIACNQGCLDHIFQDRVGTCLVNPRAGREALPLPAAADPPLRIAVVGAGPAGLSTAIAAARRGHRVTIYDANNHIGGQLLLAANVPSKSEFSDTLRWFDAMLGELGVERRLGTAITVPGLLASAPDHIILATGTRPHRIAIAGAHHPLLVTHEDILLGRVIAGQRVAILGAGGVAMDVAHYLAGDEAPTGPVAFRRAWGLDESLASPGGLVAPVADDRPRREIRLFRRGTGRMGDRLGLTTVWITRARLTALGVSYTPGAELLGFDGNALAYRVNGEDHSFTCDTIVDCTGQAPNDELAHALHRAGVSFETVGGAGQPDGMDALTAIAQGDALGCRI